MKTVIQILYVFFITLTLGCNNENHIDRYKVKVDSFKSLPDNFYAYRHGRVYISDPGDKYMIWFDLNFFGNIKKIVYIKDLNTHNQNLNEVINVFNIDTLESKSIAQNFIDLSREFKFGHINIDRKNKISFSYKDGLAEQYIWAFNDSIKKMYHNKQDFRLLQNGWFEYHDE